MHRLGRRLGARGARARLASQPPADRSRLDMAAILASSADPNEDVRRCLDAVKALNDITSGLGADVAVEAVGVPEAFELCTRLVLSRS